jgi:hypothetical protein
MHVFVYYIHSYFAVTDDSSNQTKASVSKLKPEHLSLFVKQADVNLGQLCNLKNVKVQSVVSPENDICHPKGENIVPVVVSDSISFGKTHFVTELSYDSCANISEAEDLHVINCKHELLDTLGRSVDDPELKSEVMEDLDTAVLEHNDLVDDLTCHSQGIEEELDTHAIEVMSTEEEHDETMASVIPVLEVHQAARYV